ncbi:non-canonical purine NTP pyrophosphatase [Candidatus Aerophobetes bacterium]|uniref:dITP/XTP pyrophosphatase n=1 Tax=Aerophobetes bacterium TaxID=2030807 RepID=A0A662D5P3_UNCAE|nr:MAG: non-canonical purine NTP pyrophosphatase [Candidatus Aerophobetes bacterium]
MEVVLATKNLDKIEEIKEILKDLGIKILTFKDFPDFPIVKEDKDTLEGNALKKARAIARFTGKVALADDSGLEVEALGGAPGVFSSRFAGEDATYEDNNRKLLSLLKGISLKKRRATFRCVIAISDPKGSEKIVEGVCRGKIIEENRGDNGFGYDPLFQPEGFTKTFAQMSPREKNQISHRAKALKKAKEALRKWVV